GGGAALPGWHQPQALAADERVGRRRHRLECDDVVILGRVDLRIRVAADELDDDRAAAAAEDEARRIGEVRVPVVECAVAEWTGLDPNGLFTARWDLPVVGHEAGPHRKLDVPV